MRPLVAPIVAAVWLSGCSQVITTTLPDLTPSDRPVLSSAEQERAIKEMTEKKNQSTAIEDSQKAKTP
jgi:hypothetical protein